MQFTKLGLANCTNKIKRSLNTLARIVRYSGALETINANHCESAIMSGDSAAREATKVREIAKGEHRRNRWRKAGERRALEGMILSMF